MKRKTLLMLFMALALVPLAMMGQNRATLTVYDGTATSSGIPMYGLYFDDFTKSECIIPATELTAMAGGTITAMTFYVSSANSGAWDDTHQIVFLKEVSSSTLGGSYSGTSGATTVFNGRLTMPTTTGGYTINFSTNYTYNGGNLLIGVYNDDDGTYHGISWFGVSGLASGVSAYGYNGSDIASAAYNAQTFLPKTTFTYSLDCTPSFSDPSDDYIQSFVTTGGSTNINNSSK